MFAKEALQGKVIANREVARRYFLMTLSVAGHFSEAVPGQFVMIRAGEKDFPFLGRPLGIYSMDRQGDRNIIQLLYKLVGKGTEILSRLGENEPVYVLGPLGRGFELYPGMSRVVLVGGGAGIAPLRFLAHELRKRLGEVLEIILFAGSTGVDCLAGIDALKEECTDVRISTDDGSLGHKGFVTELFERDIQNGIFEKSVIYACGPYPMLKRMNEILGNHSFRCQVLIEEKMACGVGACMGCAVEVRGGKGTTVYKRVCKDGPVFDLHEIVWK
jgi:dihydroorotate dehydrogenase electron transfer subunit